jgi:hypothetical protein
MNTHEQEMLRLCAEQGRREAADEAKRAAEAQPPRLPPGVLTAEQTKTALDAHERLPAARSYSEEQERGRQLDELLPSIEHHQREGRSV